MSLREKKEIIEQEDIAFLMEYGSSIFASNKYKETIEFHEELLRSKKIKKINFQQDAEIHYRISYSNIKLENPEKGLEIAEEYLQKPFIIEQLHLKTLFIQMKAKALAKMKKFVELAIFMDRALADTPRNVILWIEMGDIQQLQQNYKLAIECYEKALEINPNFTHLKEIIEYLKKGI
ncbi:MAG: tetratricopeptide repeat protein [Asgard group archaeon]|nr:tetratricopeptide repeat protein [Asgard group archaeon]